jgi:hypothetical protein
MILLEKSSLEFGESIKKIYLPDGSSDSQVTARPHEQILPFQMVMR